MNSSKKAYFTQYRQDAQNAFDGAIQSRGSCAFADAEAILECWFAQDNYESRCESAEALRNEERAY